VFIIPIQGVAGEVFWGIQETQSIATPQGVDKAKVKEFESFLQYVCWLDIDAAGFGHDKELRKT
jgi:hypothetical protein